MNHLPTHLFPHLAASARGHHCPREHHPAEHCVQSFGTRSIENDVDGEILCCARNRSTSQHTGGCGESWHGLALATPQPAGSIPARVFRTVTSPRARTGKSLHFEVGVRGRRAATRREAPWLVSPLLLSQNARTYRCEHVENPSNNGVCMRAEAWQRKAVP